MLHPETRKYEPTPEVEMTMPIEVSKTFQSELTDEQWEKVQLEAAKVMKENQVIAEYRHAGSPEPPATPQPWVAPEDAAMIDASASRLGLEPEVATTAEASSAEPSTEPVEDSSSGKRISQIIDQKYTAANAPPSGSSRSGDSDPGSDSHQGPVPMRVEPGYVGTKLRNPMLPEDWTEPADGQIVVDTIHDWLINNGGHGGIHQISIAVGWGDNPFHRKGAIGGFRGDQELRLDAGEAARGVAAHGSKRRN